MHVGETNKVGSNKAGAEVYNPIVRATVDKLLNRAASMPIQQAAYQAGMMPPRHKVCFVGLENRSSEELGDFKEHIRMAIAEHLAESDQFEVVSERAVEAGLRTLNLRPDELFLEDNMKMFVHAMGRNSTPVEYLIFATITSGTTVDNKDIQRDYKLTLDLINTQDFRKISESTPMRKEYNNSVTGKISGWFKK